MKYEGGPNPTNSLAVDVSIDENGKRNLVPQPTSAANLSWNVDHRRLDVAKPGRYFLVFNAKGFTFASPAVEFDGSHKGVGLYQESSTQAILSISTAAGDGERVSFSLVGTGADGCREILDPTILVEPPGGLSEAETDTGDVLRVGIEWIGLDVGYAFLQGSEKLSGISSDFYALIADFGDSILVFDAFFELANPGIVFPDGQPEYITLDQQGNEVTLTISVTAGMKAQVVPLAIVPADKTVGAPNDPTILVEPPGGITEE